MSKFLHDAAAADVADDDVDDNDAKAIAKLRVFCDYSRAKKLQHNCSIYHIYY